ncbi:MAG: hypothetical protein ACI936_002717 [Paraglaciecola sp.]
MGQVNSQKDNNNAWSIMYRNGCVIIGLGFATSLLLMFAGWYGWANDFSDKPEVWFQRSGSLMTAVLLFSDYYVYKLSSDVGQINMIPPHAMNTKDTYRPYIRKLPYIAVFLTMVATFIWGYGDLIYLRVM